MNNNSKQKHDLPGGHGIHLAFKAVRYLKFSRWGTKVPVGQGDLYVLFPSANPALVRAMNTPFWFVVIPSVAWSGELENHKKENKEYRIFLFICLKI